MIPAAYFITGVCLCSFGHWVGGGVLLAFGILACTE